MNTITLILVVTLSLIVATHAAYDWTPLDNILTTAIAKRAFPGAVALVADSTGILYVSAKGTTMYEDPGTAPMTLDTKFDMASVTKVITTTSAIALLYQHGILPSLDTKICEIFPEFAVNGKESITVENCLLHNAGFKPDPVPNYDSKTFACPETSNYHPALTYSCMDKIYAATMNQTLDHPVGQVYVYSDLSMITLMYVVGYYTRLHHLVSTSELLPICKKGATKNGILTCYFEAFIRKYVFKHLQLSQSTFITEENVANFTTTRFAPAWNDTTYRHELIKGYVSDGNAYANGGICGHAGMFSTINDVYLFSKKLMFPSNETEEGYSFLSENTVKLFTTIKDKKQSSRALGWDTNWGQKPFPEEYHFCGTLSDETYTHTGYTGTQICSDPTRKLISILLTNRVYPLDSNTQIRDVRSTFHTAVQTIYDAQKQQSDKQE